MNTASGLPTSVDATLDQLNKRGYFAERSLATVVYLSLRMGRPPGWRRRGRHEVHEVLSRTTGLALYALEGRDTS